MNAKKLNTVLVVLLLISALVLASCQPAATPTQAPPAATQVQAAPTQPPAAVGTKPDCKGQGKDGKCKVVLVNSFLGNDYRIQMQRAATAAASHDPYSKVVDFSVLNTDNTPEAQKAGVENLLASGVDAILIDAVDNTSMNDTVKKACDMGVKVVTFDITAKPGACEVGIDFDFLNWAIDAGKWLGLAAGADQHPINVIMDKGLQGVSIADDIYNGGLKGMIEAAGGKKENINIIGEYYGEFAEGVQTPLISAILAAHPDKKIDVVYTQGYCTTVVTAFKNAGLTYTPLMYCQNYNANALLLTDGTNNGIMNMTTNAGSIGALDIAYRMFMGEKVDKQYPWPTSYGVTKKGFEFTPIAKNVQFVMLERGVNAFPEYPPGFQPFWNWPGAYVQISVQEATGK